MKHLPGTLAKVAGEENIADLFTKMLPLQDHTKHGQKDIGKFVDMCNTSRGLLKL
jgi:hypothetical protein